MINKESEILEPFIARPWAHLTLTDIKKITKKKSYSYVYSTLKKFTKNKILKNKPVGNSIVYSLNLNSLKAQAYAGFIAENIGWRQKHIPLKDLEKISEKIPTPFYTLVITGSYAKKNQTPRSDLDVVIIVDDTASPKRVYAELKYESEMNIPPIHLYVFKKSEFLLMLTNKEANYGKEIAKNNFIMFGGENYYKILLEAIGNGFKNIS